MKKILFLEHLVLFNGKSTTRIIKEFLLSGMEHHIAFTMEIYTKIYYH